MPVVVIGLLLGFSTSALAEPEVTPLPATGETEARDVDGVDAERARLHARYDDVEKVKRRTAVREFKEYLDRNPEVDEIYDEERVRQSVPFTGIGAVTALIGVAAAAYATVTGSWDPGVVTAIGVAGANSVSGYLNLANKFKKARGATLDRAVDLAKENPRVEKPDVARFFKAGLVRAGDIDTKRLREVGARPRMKRSLGRRIGTRLRKIRSR